MRLSDLAATLPNGFHDAELTSVAIDYVRALATIRLRVDVSAPSGEPGSVFRAREIEFSDLRFLSIEPPRIDERNSPREPLWIDAGDGIAKSSPDVTRMAADSNATRIYVNQWNARMHVVAGELSFRWLE